MFGLMLIGMISGAALLFIAFKLGIRKVLGYDIWFDALITFLLASLFHGTYAGMVAALAGGFFVSITLFVMKRAVGYDRLGFHGWKSYPPRWKSLHTARQSRPRRSWKPAFVKRFI